MLNISTTFDPTVYGILVKWFGILGISSVAGLITFYSAWIAFPPEIVVDTVIDKAKHFSSESRIKIKNNGKLPAFQITSTINGLNVSLGGLLMNDCCIKNPPKTIPRIAGGESAEISVAPGISVADGAKYSSFSYSLKLTYLTKFPFFTRQFTKNWSVKLRNVSEEFFWDVEITQ